MHPLKGRKQTSEHVAKRVAALRASGTYQQQSDSLIARNKARIGEKRTDEYRAKKSAEMKGKSTAWLKGRKLTEEHRRNIAAYWAENKEKHNNYKDGKGWERTSERVADMQRIEYRLWREKVFARDNWTCKHCGERGGLLHADHIKPYSTHPELRYDVGNGQVLCAPCHRKTPTYGSNVHKIKEKAA